MNSPDLQQNLKYGCGEGADLPAVISAEVVSSFFFQVVLMPFL